MNSIERIILIDDDKALNYVTELTLKKVIPGVEVLTFHVPEEGLSFIAAGNSKQQPVTLLLLDINMPGFDGWELLASFVALPAETRSSFVVYMLSSSIDENDIQKAEAHPVVSGYIQKPLTRAKVDELMAVPKKIHRA